MVCLLVDSQTLLPREENLRVPCHRNTMCLAEIELLARLPPCPRCLLCPSHPGLFFVSPSFADLYFVSTEDIPMCITSLGTALEGSTCTYTRLQPLVGENCSEFYNTGLEIIQARLARTGYSCHGIPYSQKGFTICDCKFPG